MVGIVPRYPVNFNVSMELAPLDVGWETGCRARNNCSMWSAVVFLLLCEKGGSQIGVMNWFSKLVGGCGCPNVTRTF